MRSRLICSLVSAASAAIVFASAGRAHAEVTRLRITLDDLPRQDEPHEIAAKSVMLPNGVKDRDAIPKSWRKLPESGEQMENARCTDDRRASVGTFYGNSGTTHKIWEKDGKIWLDRADLDTTYWYVEVKHAERVPLARITDGVWGYRRKNAVVLVTATDTGFMEEGGFYECAIRETEIAAPTGTGLVTSSPADVNAAMKTIAKNNAEPGKPPKWSPEWVGVEYKIIASVSKSSADAATTLNLVVKRP